MDRRLIAAVLRVDEPVVIAHLEGAGGNEGEPGHLFLSRGAGGSGVLIGRRRGQGDGDEPQAAKRTCQDLHDRLLTGSLADTLCIILCAGGPVRTRKSPAAYFLVRKEGRTDNKGRRSE